MRVLILQSELGVLRGGGENFTKNLFTAFAARGHYVAAAFTADPKGRHPIPLPACIEPIPIRGWWSRKLGQAALSTIGRCVPFESRLKNGWNQIQEAICWRTIRWHDRRFQNRIQHELGRCWADFDALYVHCNSTLASTVAQRRPTVLRLAGPVSAELAPTLRSVHAVCANGDALAQIRTFLGDRAIELPIGLDERIFRPGPTSIRKTLGWKEEQRVVGYVGRLTHLKGVDLLAAAFSKLAQTVADARLLIVGSGEEARNICSILAKEITSGVVHIEPDVNHAQLPEWYRAMDVLVMPSRYENFSNAVVEAMACGIPFLASNVGGNKLLAELGAGWTFEPESIPSLGACLQSVIENRAEMEARGAIGSRYVQGRYSWSASAELLESILASRLGVKDKDNGSHAVVTRKSDPCSD